MASTMGRGSGLLPHLVSSHCAGPGARNASHVTCQPQCRGDMTGLLMCPGILPVIIIIALTLYVLTRDALSSHVFQCHVT